MNIRNLDRLFRPRSVALVGASPRPGSIGNVLVHNLLGGGVGDVMLVNPKHASIDGHACFPDVANLPAAPDLGVVAVPARAVPGGRGPAGTPRLLGRGRDQRRVRGARPGRPGAPGRAPRRHRARVARIIGPNCLGVLVPHAGLNASFSHLPAREGSIAFVTQSGAIATAVLDWAQPRGIGFSHVVSLGTMADVDFGDMLDYLAKDPRTDAILLYIEAIKEPRKFMSASRAAARMKPVLAVKAARHEATASAATSHTGALAGADAVCDAAFRRAGIVRLDTLEELFDAVETLAIGQVPRPTTSETRRDRLAIVTNGGGLGVLAADALADRGGTLAQLAPSTIERLNEVLPETWSHANPVDIVGDAPGSRYEQAVEAVAQDPGVDGILVINCPTAVVSRMEAAEAVIRAAARRRRVALLTSFVGAETTSEPRLLMETPPSLPEVIKPDVERARSIVDGALGEEREWLSAPEAKSVLDAYRLLTAPGRTARDAAGAAEAAAALGGSVALKILSPDITHRSDIGGVILGLEGPLLVRDAADKLMRSVREALPRARIGGVVVESMVHRPGAIELIVGAYDDPSFGPVLVFGRGGIAAEVIRDRALGLPPLNMHLAHELIRRTRVYERLKGYRNVPPVNLDALAPALDARIRVARHGGRPEARLAIRPYPVELEEVLSLPGGRTLLLRPIRPGDEPALARSFSRLTPEEIRFRFLIPMKTFSHMQTARFTQIDYDRDMVMILTERGPPGTTEIYAVVQINTLPRRKGAEFALLVEEAMAGLGLGPYLLRRIIDYARERGIEEIHGDVLADNTTMLKLCRALGFTAADNRIGPGVIRMSRRLDASAPA